MFFLIVWISRDTKTKTTNDDDYDYESDYYSRPQIQALGHGETPARPFGKTISKGTE